MEYPSRSKSPVAIQIAMQFMMDEGIIPSVDSKNKIDYTNLTTEELKKMAIIPKGGLYGKEKDAFLKNWIPAMREANRRIAKEEAKEFASLGSAQEWFSKWEPKTKKEQEISDGIDSAYDVIDSLYPMILKRGIDNPEDMGVLQADRNGKSEGIRVKKEPYGSDSILIQVCSVSGPMNHDPTDNSVEFEEGSHTHLFKLAYKKLPTQKDLLSDICAYPLVKQEGNLTDKRYRSEGFTNSAEANNGIAIHKTWNSLSQQEQQNLIKKFSEK